MVCKKNGVLSEVKDGHKSGDNNEDGQKTG